MKNIITTYLLIFTGIISVLIVSCTKNENDKETGTVTDIDGNVYHTVTLGSQVWMVENLRVTHYRNGDIIGTTTPASLNISGETSPKYQWAYGGKENNVDIYGRLYTWHVTTDSRKVCPKGWHIPSWDEWATFEEYLRFNGFNCDGTVIGYEYAKALASDLYWASSKIPGAPGNNDYPAKRNATGYTALPGGFRDFDGPFTDVGNIGYWWSSTDFSTPNGWAISIEYDYEKVSKMGMGKNYGFSLRCLKD